MSSLERREYANIWKCFGLQAQAIEYSNENYDLPIFSRDKRGSKIAGPKEYIVTSYHKFWIEYMRTPKELRNYYEIIKPGRPSHIHFDCEFRREFNSHITGDEEANKMDQLFIKKLKEFMKKLGFIQDVTEEYVEIVTLDSSNNKKFSRHHSAIIKNPKYGRIKNNYHCGAVQRRFFEYLKEEYGEEFESNPFIIWDKQTIRKNKKKDDDNNNNDNNDENIKDEEKKTEEIPEVIKIPHFYGDISIYTQLRNWRLLGSCKSGQEYRPLLLWDKEKQSSSTELTEDLFHKTLIQRIEDQFEDDNIVIIKCLEINGEEPRSGCFLKGTTKFSTNTTHVYNSLKSNIDPNIFNNTNGFNNFDDDDEEDKVNKSIPDFVSKICKCIEEEWGPGTYVKLKKYNDSSEIMKFESNSKVCRIKQKSLDDSTLIHTGNHIYFLCYLRSGIFRQLCYSDKSTCTSKDIMGRVCKRTNGPYYLTQELCYDINLFIQTKIYRKEKRNEKLIDQFIDYMNEL